VNRGIESSALDVDRMADVLTRLAATGRKFVLAKSWCSEEDYYVCWIEQHNRCKYGLPFVGASIERAIESALLWIDGEQTWVYPMGAGVDDGSW